MIALRADIELKTPNLRAVLSSADVVCCRFRWLVTGFLHRAAARFGSRHHFQEMRCVVPPMGHANRVERLCSHEIVDPIIGKVALDLFHCASTDECSSFVVRQRA